LSIISTNTHRHHFPLRLRASSLAVAAALTAAVAAPASIACDGKRMMHGAMILTD
jgi:hypothetical protein